MESSVSRPTPTKAETTAHRRRASRLRARTVIVVVLTALITAFALLNFRHVQVNFIVTMAHPPLIIVIAACVVVGMVLGLLGGRRTTKGKR